MISSSFTHASKSLAFAALVVAVCPVVADAADRNAENSIQAELFAAMDAGQIDVRIIPRDATRANVLIKNLTDQPIELRLPAAFASVPIQAQMGGMGGGGMGGGGMGGGGMGGGGGQAGGGGMGGGGMGGGGMGGGGGGMMRVPPQRMQKVKVTTVCLEHGKPDPNPKMAYKMVPLEQFSSDPKIRVLCEALGNGEVSQNTAQAAAWHIMDKMSWEQLAAKNRVESRYTGNVKWFSPIEVRSAMTVVAKVSRIAAIRATESSSTESSSDDRTTESESSGDSSSANDVVLTGSGRYDG